MLIAMPAKAGIQFLIVIPAKAGIQLWVFELDPGLRRDDEQKRAASSVLSVADDDLYSRR
ncbi:MAG TPA: hypothetical protein VLC71_07845 [Thermomonas sp.]|nr:hypothetical protein [Thermomonas sp.]